MIKEHGKILQGSIGTTFKLTEENHYNDSDFFAHYLDLNTGKIVVKEYATTRFACGLAEYNADIDLTKENLEKWWNNGGKQYIYDGYHRSEDRNSKQVNKNKLVRVVSGRKVPLDTEGIVFYIKDVNYDPYKRWWGKELKIGIKTKDYKVYWTYAKNVEVVNPEIYIDKNKIKKQTQDWYNSMLSKVQ